MFLINSLGANPHDRKIKISVQGVLHEKIVANVKTHEYLNTVCNLLQESYRNIHKLDVAMITPYECMRERPGHKRSEIRLRRSSTSKFLQQIWIKPESCKSDR